VQILDVGPRQRIALLAAVLDPVANDPLDEWAERARASLQRLFQETRECRQLASALPEGTDPALRRGVGERVRALPGGRPRKVIVQVPSQLGDSLRLCEREPHPFLLDDDPDLRRVLATRRRLEVVLAAGAPLADPTA